MIQILGDDIKLLHAYQAEKDTVPFSAEIERFGDNLQKCTVVYETVCVEVVGKLLTAMFIVGYDVTIDGNISDIQSVVIRWKSK